MADKDKEKKINWFRKAKNTLRKTQDGGKNVGNGVFGAVGDVANTGTGIVKGTAGTVGSVAENGKQAVTTVGSGVLNAAGTITGKGMDAVERIPVVGGITRKGKDMVGTVANTGGNVVKNVGNGVGNVSSKGIGTVNNGVGSVTNGLGTGLKNGTSSVGAVGSNVLSGAGNAVGGMATAGKDTVGAVANIDSNIVKDVGGGAVGGITNGVGSMKNDVVSGMKTGTSSIGTVGTNVVNGSGSFAGGIMTNGKDAVGTVLNTGGNAVKDVGGGVVDVAGKGKGVVTSNIGNITSEFVPGMKARSPVGEAESNFMEGTGAAGGAIASKGKDTVGTIANSGGNFVKDLRGSAVDVAGKGVGAVTGGVENATDGVISETRTGASTAEAVGSKVKNKVDSAVDGVTEVVTKTDSVGTGGIESTLNSTKNVTDVGAGSVKDPVTSVPAVVLSDEPTLKQGPVPLKRGKVMEAVNKTEREIQKADGKHVIVEKTSPTGKKSADVVEETSVDAQVQAHEDKLSISNPVGLGSSVDGRSAKVPNDITTESKGVGPVNEDITTVPRRKTPDFLVDFEKRRSVGLVGEKPQGEKSMSKKAGAAAAVATGAVGAMGVTMAAKKGTPDGVKEMTRAVVPQGSIQTPVPSCDVTDESLLDRKSSHVASIASDVDARDSPSSLKGTTLKSSGEEVEHVNIQEEQYSEILGGQLKIREDLEGMRKEIAEIRKELDEFRKAME